MKIDENEKKYIVLRDINSRKNIYNNLKTMYIIFLQKYAEILRYIDKMN